MQIQADLLNKNVVRSKSPESTALGAAFLQVYPLVFGAVLKK